MGVVSTRTGRLRQAVESRTGTGLLLPLLLFDLLVFVVPFGYLLRISLSERGSTQAYVEGTWSLEGYSYLLDPSNTISETFLFTLGFGVVVTVVSVAVATVYAHAMWRADGPLRIALVAGALVSMFTAIVVKLFAALLVYSPDGVLNGVLVSVGVVGEPLRLVNNGVGAVIGQLYIVVPYSILAVYAVLSTVDESLLEAARDLGANGPRAFVEVAVPHAVPGMLVAGVISFTWSIGSYAAPLLLGSGNERTNGVLVSDLLLREFDWVAAAALAVVVTATVLGGLVVVRLVLSRREVSPSG
ncbi:MAG: ABC-type spermidine/putrescine transport system, permease component I [halophilic archaeon J07HB67]|nr:MAG: ABC-type spermidine/putrescine transport system, permease component I [halophilic archaeon J07HB67]